MIINSQRIHSKHAGQTVQNIFTIGVQKKNVYEP